MNAPRVVLEQIDKAANQNRKLGTVQLGKPITLSYVDREDANVESGVSIDVNWKKRYYLFDRGDYFPLDIQQFINYFGRIYRTNVNGPNGNFIDYLEESAVNVQYSTEVYVTNDTTVNFTISVTNGSLSIYVNQVELLKSSLTNCYISSSQILNLKKGWNIIDIFVYHKSSNGVISFTGDLGKRVSTWRSPDFTPPDVPTWSKTPIETVYIDPKSGPALQNILRWQNSKYNNPYSSVRGWGVYKQVVEPAKDDDGNVIRIISGWGTKGLVVSGDKRSYYPSDMQVIIGNFTASVSSVSGTDYRTADDQTTVTVYNANYSYTPAAVGYALNRYLFKHLFDIEWDASLPYIVSGIDNKDIVQNATVSYALDAYDDSINRNRSEKSSIKTYTSGDFTAPGKLTAADIVGTASGFKKISCVFKHPEDWANYSPDLVGIRVWSTPNPTIRTDDMIAQIPLTISGTSSIITINSTIVSGLSTDLKDATSYTFYLSTYDWHGNSILTNLPSITASTSVKIRTRPDDEDSYIEIDSDTNTLKIYADL